MSTRETPAFKDKNNLLPIAVEVEILDRLVSQEEKESNPSLMRKLRGLKLCALNLCALPPLKPLRLVEV